MYVIFITTWILSFYIFCVSSIFSAYPYQARLNMQASEEKGPRTRCNPGVVSMFAENLSEEVEQTIEGLDLSNVLNLKLSVLSCRKLCGLLMERAVVNEDGS